MLRVNRYPLRRVVPLVPGKCLRRSDSRASHLTVGGVDDSERLTVSQLRHNGLTLFTMCCALVKNVTVEPPDPDLTPALPCS